MPTYASAKDRILDLVGGMPHDSGFDDIIRELVFAAAVSRGLADVTADRTLSDDEMRHAIELWAAE